MNPSPAPGLAGVCAAACPPARPPAHPFFPPEAPAPVPAASGRRRLRASPRVPGSGARGGGQQAGAAQPVTDRKPRPPNPSSIHLRGIAADSPKGLRKKALPPLERGRRSGERRGGGKRGLMLKSVDTGWEGNHLEIKLRGELNTQPSLRPSVRPSHCHPPVLHPRAPAAVPRGWDPPGEGAARPQVRAAVRCAVRNSAERCRPGRRAKGSWSGGEGPDLPVHPQHHWPPWTERRGFTSVGWDQGG